MKLYGGCFDEVNAFTVFGKSKTKINTFVWILYIADFHLSDGSGTA